MLSIYDLKRILGRGADIPEDDIRIIDSWAVYEENTQCPVEERKLEFLCYELEIMNPQTGEKQLIYKALKFVRVIRLPKDAKQSLSFMQMQEQVMAGVYERGYNLVTLIANIMKPVALGLLYLYGVQGVARDIETAKRIAHEDFLGLVAMLQGTYRVLEMRIVQAQESEWLREKMYSMDFITAIRGIPKAHPGGENAGNKGFGGKNINPQSQGTIEELIAGMADYEYIVQVLSSPVQIKTLKAWAAAHAGRHDRVERSTAGSKIRQHEPDHAHDVYGQHGPIPGKQPRVYRCGQRQLLPKRVVLDRIWRKCRTQLNRIYQPELWTYFGHVGHRFRFSISQHLPRAKSGKQLRKQCGVQRGSKHIPEPWPEFWNQL